MSQDFAELARRYCDFIDASDSIAQRDLVQGLERHFVDLYASALVLPHGDPAEQEENDMTHEEWVVVYDRLTRQLADASQYWMVFDPFATEPPSLGDLADDAADIYRDLRRGLTIIDAGRPRGEAIYEWRSAFDQHWGRHAAEAMYALRVLQDGSGSQYV